MADSLQGEKAGHPVISFLLHFLSFFCKVHYRLLHPLILGHSLVLTYSASLFTPSSALSRGNRYFIRHICHTTLSALHQSHSSQDSQRMQKMQAPHALHLSHYSSSCHFIWNPDETKTIHQSRIRADHFHFHRLALSFYTDCHEHLISPPVMIPAACQCHGPCLLS